MVGHARTEVGGGAVSSATPKAMGGTFGRYELLRKLAAGGMAEVYLARQWSASGFFRDLALKRLFRHLAEHESALEMFQFEARLLAHLSHPHIPQVYELDEAEGQWYLAMEWVDGPTVADLYRAGARMGHVMPMSVALGLLHGVAEGLHHAHERRDKAGRPLRIVHRDVTPHNAMVTRDGVVKLMDFGVARTAAREESNAGTVKGTLSYMAPEQVRCLPLDKRADVFALGVNLYELTTGTRLFRGNDVQVMTAIVEQDVPPPTVRVPNYPADLEEIVMAALVRDRSRRLPSAAHFAMAIEDYAVRHGLLIGPRALAQYVGQVFPYQHMRENEVGLVGSGEVNVTLEEMMDVDWAEPTSTDLAPPSSHRQPPDDVIVDGRSTDVAVEIALGVPDFGDETSLSGDLVTPPTDEPAFAFPPVPNVDEAPPARPAPLPDLATLDERMSPLGDLLFDDPSIEGGHGAEPIAVTDEEPLDGFDEDSQRRPVVLLEAPKQKAEGEDYLRELARRLEVDDP